MNRIKPIAVAAAFAVFSGMLIGLSAQCQSNQQPWDEQLKEIKEQLKQGHWDIARQGAQYLSETLAEHSGGTIGDHRDHADKLGGAMAGKHPLAESIVMAKASAYRAIAEAELDRRDEARWHWYLAQNLSRDLRSMDLSPYGDAGAFLHQNLIVDAQRQLEGKVDVLDPVLPEGAARENFQPPVRINVTYPRRPQDLRNRDRFSHVVFVQITIEADGEVTQPMVMDGGFYPGLIYRAFEALRTWKYEPAKLRGNPIPFRYIMPIVFADDRPDRPGVSF